jgi:hypothetical protein
VKNAFLHGHLEENVHYQQPPGSADHGAPDHVCRLQKSLYVLKQAPRAWYQCFATFIRQLGFIASTSNTSLFVLREGTSLAYLLLYIDDIMLTASSSALLQRIVARLSSEFAMTDLGALHHFLGIAVSLSHGRQMASSSPSDSTMSSFFSVRAWLSVIPHRHLLTLTPSSPRPKGFCCQRRTHLSTGA